MTLPRDGQRLRIFIGVEQATVIFYRSGKAPE
jgi:hypothetical protein